jgi:site-specific recombinase XerD
MTTDDYHRAAAVRAVKGERPPQATGRALRQAELRQLIEACLTPTVQRKGEPPTVTPKDHRDAALVAAGYGCGLRRHEIAGLELADLDLAQRRFVVRGKGNKERVVPIPPGAVRALRAYLDVRGDEPGPLFVRSKKGGQFVQMVTSDQGRLAPITDQAVYHILQRRSEEAVVAPFSPHDLRRTYIGDLLDEGADLSVAQKLAGHADPSTTAGYDRRGERAKEQAAARLNVPYRQ